MDVKGKTAIITGANRGLGFAMSEKLASMGATVVMACRDSKKGKEAAAKITAKGFKAVAMQVKVDDTNSINKFAKEVAKKFPVVDILINNAGVNSEPGETGIENLDLKMFQNIMKINLVGPVWMCKNIVPLMKKSDDGRIVNFSSGLGQLSVPRMGPYPSYSISKTAVNQLTKFLAEELKNTKVKVFSVDPGWVKTDLGGPQAPLSIEEGIVTPIWLATADTKDLVSGEFYKEKKILGW
ncbi:MAG TPA: SDR family NAD(P)-dependent oxidoreductase [Candidatus Goldiibacteriota bacterium]|nr:SDR family NAD(P)-dependent oxidoreductase [Candidatus Goldiibacteriota bacterium]HPN64298.1 SDR family NAD(P)-dependent oxidoreductase [Candidatus Goldiibacteriota bacterium]HRQ43131.1 SDR family NAD(P)-dependent oxidoreductase [Candidatus Goldiibacteriota bacterium]